MSTIIIREIIKGDIAVSTSDGDLVYNLITDYFKNHKTVSIDFEGISIMTTAFLNAAIGQLYSNPSYSDDFLNKHLHLKNVAKEDRILFSEVVKRAKEYFRDKDRFEDSTNSIINGD
ncbi:STAS-like domain-containing protein [Flavobacterium aquicola]|uniref:Uncharacterized protein DUF4325 n=1 Tax=Flavobacterium aquicola TaxID=1682742 RepID=A0A3E0E1F2_9FLAO|nr:STAS-like domain-containing protein [Flavobacterium aquicola]REG90736.1 uncharacterized protein DUF4325 [Flavobacterium aquicola]